MDKERIEWPFWLYYAATQLLVVTAAMGVGGRFWATLRVLQTLLVAVALVSIIPLALEATARPALTRITTTAAISTFVAVLPGWAVGVYSTTPSKDDLFLADGSLLIAAVFQIAGFFCYVYEAQKPSDWSRQQKAEKNI